MNSKESNLFGHLYDEIDGVDAYNLMRRTFLDSRQGRENKEAEFAAWLEGMHNSIRIFAGLVHKCIEPAEALQNPETLAKRMLVAVATQLSTLDKAVQEHTVRVEALRKYAEKVPS